MFLYGSEPYNVVTPEQKQIGDSNFTFFEESKEEERIRNKEKYDKMA